MRKLIFVSTFALATALSLSACNKQDDDQSQTTAQAPKQIAKPSDPNDLKGWNAYLGQIVQQNMQGMSGDQTYPYLVNAGDSDAAKGERDRQLQAVQDSVARGVLPGNMMVFAGPDSSKTADLIIAAFKDAKPGSFNKVIVLFIGDKADQQRVEDALKPTAASVRFVAM